MTSLFVKTPKGIEEVTQRNHGLDLKSRRVLIMVDGKRDQDALAAMIAGDDIGEIVAKLAADGFIDHLKAPEPAPAAAATVAPPIDDAERFGMARNFMMNTVNAFLGVAGSGLITRVEQASGFEELRGHYQAWQEAIRLSADGRQRAPELESRLAALLS